MYEIYTLNELKKITSSYGVYDEFVTIEDSSIDSYYKRTLPHKCDCGAEFIMTYSNTQLQCCNPLCYIKKAHRLAYFLSYHGFKGFGPKTAEKLYRDTKDFKYKETFLNVFMMDEYKILSSVGDSALVNLNQAKYNLATKPILYSDVIASLGIKGVGKNSPIATNIVSKEPILVSISDGTISDLCKKVGVYTPAVPLALTLSSMDILAAFSVVMPKSVSMPDKDIYVAITGRVSVNGVSYTRSEFLELLSSIKENGVQLYRIVETLDLNKLNYVIADEPSSSRKYQLGKKNNILITADEFYNMLSNRRI